MVSWCVTTVRHCFAKLQTSYSIGNQISIENMDAAIKFGNSMLPEMQETLARQRRDYGISEKFQPEFPIEGLDDNAKENAPINNLAMENVCGRGGGGGIEPERIEICKRLVGQS